MDPFEKLDLKGDTTFALALEAQARKHEISFFKPKEKKPKRLNVNIINEIKKIDNQHSNLLNKKVELFY